MTYRGMSSSTEKLDVFLSFRGEDTRTNFTSHLYAALKKEPIDIFIDYDMPRGADVWPTLSKAIQNSRLSIVILSENYATSKWCLEELREILECRKHLSQIVIPVFYHTYPSDIRRQTGTYGRAFAKHEPRPGDKHSESIKRKVLKWRHALFKAGNISGWPCQNHTNETQLIKDVVKDVLEKLELREPEELKGIISEKNCRNVELLMKKFRVIGIWGMGGIGKTTIAKALFAKLFPQYDNSCLVLNTKEYSLAELHFELFKEKISRSKYVGSTIDMTRLKGKNVFIVLDDVDDSDQIKNWCEGYHGLSQASRLIITTRDRQLLEESVDWIYGVEEWKATESLKFFCLEAFKQDHPIQGYEGLSDVAVDYAGGNPLALRVLGSHLRNKDIDFWESTFRKLNISPDETIQKVLRVSYDGLKHKTEKKIFLDIAFFFKGEKKDHVIRILDACDFEAISGIVVLENKALITISNSNRIQMHDLLQKMAYEIVCNEDEENPEGRSRLRDSDACEVIKENKGTKAIQGITLDLSQITALPLHADTFTKMKALRFLKLCNPLDQNYSNTYLKLPTVLGPFSDKLRYVEWIGYPFESLPRPFFAELLVEICMPHSNVKQLWQGEQKLGKLEGIDLSECKELEKLPDLSKASRLKWVNLSGCRRLSYLHPSVLSADTLVTLILDRCTNLKSVKGMQHLQSLEMISVNGCSSLEEFAVSSDSLQNLDLSNTGIQRLETSIGLLQNLKWLNLEGLRLSHLPNELSGLKSLLELRLSCSRLVIDKEQLHDLFNGLQFLQILHLKECSNLFELPDNISVLSKTLQELRLDGCNVTKLPESIKDLEKLEILSLENCKELQCLPELPPLIKQLYAVNCTSLVSVSNLKTLATKMRGMAKHISFKNSLNLDADSLKCIVESLLLTMMSAALDNVLVRRLRVAIHSYNYTSVEFCLPGKRVPKQVSYRTKKTSITIELPSRSNLQGFIYSVVLSTAGGMMKHGTKIKCECPLAEGTKVTWLKIDITKFKSDHVYVWYDPFHCDGILKYYKSKVRFDFFVANDMGEVDGSICIKKCGVRLISVSELHNVLLELDLDSDKKKELEKGIELETARSMNLTSIERSHEMENDGSCELSSSDGIVESDSDSDKVEADSGEEGSGRKDHHSNVEESVKSTPKETKESTNAIKSEGNNGTPTKPNARLHEPAEIQSDKENESEEISITEPKSATFELESVEEDNESWPFSDVEESIESTQKETETSTGRGLKENTRDSTKVTIEKVKSKGNKATPTEPGARLHELIESQPEKENASKNKSIIEPKSMVDEPESAEEDNGRKDHSSYVEEPGYIHKDTKTSAIRSLNTEYIKVDKSNVNKGASTKEKSITKPKLVMVELESAEEDNKSKDHFTDVEKWIRSRRKETKTSDGRGRKKNTTKSTKVVKSKGNASKHKSSENKSDWTDNIEEAKHSEENQNLHGEQIVDLIVEEPYHAKESEPMEGQDGSDEDHVAKLYSILSAKATFSTNDVAIREALHNLESLLENSLESILGDVELQGQLHMSLKCIQLASEEKVSPNVAKLVESMTPSIEDLFKDFTFTQKVVQEHTTLLQQKEKLLQLVRDTKKRQELLNKETSQCEFETESLDKEAKKLNENIQILLEKKKTVELKKNKLKETLERCDFEKKKLKDEAKNRVPESRELIVAIEKSESSYAAALSKLKKLNNKWEGFRTTFAENSETLLAHNTWWHRAEVLLIIFIFIFNIFLSYVGSEVDLHSE